MEANPQTENGFTKLANELLEAFSLSRISGEENQVFWTIIRKTYGFNKTWDEISLSQFCLATGMNKQNVCRALSKLIKKKMIIKTDKGKIAKYRIQKDYTTWLPLSKLITLSNLIKPIIKTDKENVINLETYKRNKNTKDTITKERRTKTLSVTENLQSIVERWNTFASEIGLSPIIDFNDDRKTRLRTRLRKKTFNFDAILRAIRLSPHLLGESEGGWRCSFDWIVKNKTNYMKVLEGQYYKKPKLTPGEENTDWAIKKQKEIDNDRQNK